MSWFKPDLIVKGLSYLASPLIDYFKHKSEMKALDRQSERVMKERKLEATILKDSTQMASDAEFNRESIRNSGWKDEYLTIILSIPLIGCFIPALADDILKGFMVLEATPDWYKAGIGLMIAAVFGQVAYYRNREKAIELERKRKDVEKDAEE